jgi:hypothetical protein
MYGWFDAGIIVEGTRANAGEVVVGCDGAKTRATVATEAPKYAGSGLILGQVFLPIQPHQLFVIDPDSGSEGATREFLTIETMAAPHIG